MLFRNIPLTPRRSGAVSSRGEVNNIPLAPLKGGIYNNNKQLALSNQSR